MNDPPKKSPSACRQEGQSKFSINSDSNNKYQSQTEVNVSDKKPIVYLPSGDVQIIDTARQTFEIIGPRNELFYRGGTVMELCKNGNGDLNLSIIRPAAARTRFEKYCSFFAWRKGSGGGDVLAPRAIPHDIADALLQSLEAQELLPHVTGLINCPIIREDNGALDVISKGYDINTGVLVTGGEIPPQVELTEAVVDLNEIMCEFEFQSPGDRSRAFACLITPALKLSGILRGNIPATVAEADESQSGKTYFLKLAAALYNE